MNARASYAKSFDNARNAFSHSAQCDEFFSIVSPLLGGVPHMQCACWCHGALTLFAGADGPEYDLTPPPEYATSADLAFVAAQTSGAEIYETQSAGSVVAERQLYDLVTLLEPDHLYNDLANSYESTTAQALAAKHTNRSPRELASNKCDTCGDKLADCECVE